MCTNDLEGTGAKPPCVDFPMRFLQSQLLQLNNNKIIELNDCIGLPKQIKSITMSSNKKQRGRRDKQKRIAAQKEAQQKESEVRAQQEAEDVRAQQELAIRRAEVATEAEKTLRRAELEALLGTPAIDKCIQEIARAASTTAATTVSIAAVSKSSSSSSTVEQLKVVCYHGSSAEHFVAGSEFLKMVKSYILLQKKYAGGGLTQEKKDAENKFFRDQEIRKIRYTDEFANFVFALGVSFYLKVTSEEKENYHRLQTSGGRTLGERKQTVSFELEVILKMGMSSKYDAIPQTKGEKVDHKKFRKYCRDVESERGIINCLYRETKNDCDCMKTKKVEANNMVKMDLCNGCRKSFPKARTKICDGCNAVVYCSTKCSIDHWPCHKPYCTKEQERQANIDVNQRKNNDKTKKKETAATTGTATSNTNGSMTTPVATVAAAAAASSSALSISEANGDDQPHIVAAAAVSSVPTTTTTTATATIVLDEVGISTINATAAIEEAREKAARRKKRILENANNRMNYVSRKNVQDEVQDKTSISNAARIRVARQRRYGKKTASTVTIRKDDDRDGGDGGCSGGGGKIEY